MSDLYFGESLKEFCQDIDHYKENFPDSRPDLWFIHPLNRAVTDGKGNWGIFDKMSDGIYTGHYFFVVRGKAARDLGKEMIDFFFAQMPNEKVLRGFTPVENKAARWMSRQLGFKSYGIVETDAGPHELFILIKDTTNG